MRRLLSTFVTATQSGDLHSFTDLLASGVRVVTDNGGKLRAVLDVIDGTDRLRASWSTPREEARARGGSMTSRCGRRPSIDGLPAVVVDGPEGPVQTAALEIEGDVIRALYAVRNPGKLQHLAAPHVPQPSPSDLRL